MKKTFKNILTVIIVLFGIYFICLAFTPKTTVQNNMIIKYITYVGFGISLLFFAYSLFSESDSEKQNVELNKKLDKLIEQFSLQGNKKGGNKMSIEKYINDRLNDQIKYYDLKSIEYKKKHENISLATIIISALIALVPAFIDILPNCKGIITFLSALLAATITILQAIDKLKKYNDLFYQFRMTCEKLKQEKELYLYQSGEYKRTDEMTNEQLFVERCESIMATENGTWAQLNEKKQTN